MRPPTKRTLGDLLREHTTKAGLLVLVGLCSALTSSAQSLPNVTSLAASGQSNTVATLNGSVNPNGAATTAWFEWGLTANSYSNRTSASSLGSGSVAVAANRALSGLTPGLIYHGRMVGSNSAGVAYGRDVSFGSPALTLLGPAETNVLVGGTFTDQGATAWGAVQAIAARDGHNLALRNDGTVVAWGWNSFNQTSVPVGLSNVVAVACGYSHSLALQRDGTVVAWGRNDDGQTSVPGGLSDVVAVAGGGYHSLALQSDGAVVAWGWNGHGQSSVPGGLSNVVAVAGGFAHSLALQSDGTVVAWGNNDDGQTSVPGGLSDVVAVAAGDYHSLALQSDGTVVAWGWNAFGQTSVPSGLNNVVAVACGVFHSLALQSDGTVVGWGYNGYGQTSLPSGLSNVVAVAGGFYHSLVLQSDGTVAAWGDNGLGQTSVPGSLTALTVSTNGTVDVNTPGTYTITYSVTNSLGGVSVASRTVVIDPIPAPTMVTLAASGQSNTVATLNGTVNPNGSATTAWFEWGLAVNSYTNATAVSSPGSGSAAVAVSHAITGLTPGLIYHGRMVGSNVAGIVYGRDVRFGSPALTLLGPVETNFMVGGTFSEPGATAWGAVQEIAGGGFHSLALQSDGTVVAWGWNGDGQTSVLGGLNNVVAVAGGGNHSLSLQSDGTVVAWGVNNFGQTSVPVGLSNVVAVAGGGFHSLSLQSDGTVVAWGWNDYGQTSVPVGLSNVVAMAGGITHSLALQSDDTVVAWGRNDDGQTSVPGGLSNVVAVAGGGFHSLSLQSDGTVVAWGRNAFGQTSVPVGLSNVVAVAGGFWHSLALQSDGTVVAWGNNGDGQTSVPGNLTALDVTTHGTVDVNTPGTYTITYSVTNALGGVNVASRTVVIVPIPPPTVVTLAASGQSNSVATLNGTVNPNGSDTTAWFEWGLVANSYSNRTAVSSLGSDRAAFAVSHALTGLTPGLIYHGRMVASNSAGIAYGRDVSFGSPALTLLGPVQTNFVVGDTFIEPGASAWGAVQAIAGGVNHSLALQGDGTVVAWGNNDYGQTSVPGGLSNVVAVAGGGYHSLALQSDGTVVAWGNNADGQTSVPSGLSNVVAVACGAYHSLALQSDGTVMAWGWNDDGQTSVPGGLSNVVAVAGGGYHSLALQSDGTVVAWGWNDYGQTSVPGGLRDVVTVAGGAFHSLALQSDGTVVAWGENTYGQTSVPGSLTTLDVITHGTVDVNTPGTYTITYSVTNALGGVNVASRTVVVLNSPPIVNTALTNQTATYGTAFSFTFPTNAFSDPGGDALSYTATDLPPGLTFTGATRTFAGTPTAAGSFLVIVIAGDGQTPELFATNSFMLAVGKAPLTITADDRSRACGAPDPELTFSFTGLVGSDTADVLDALPVARTDANAISGPGLYPITLTGGSDDNYEFTLVGGTLVITNGAPGTGTVRGTYHGLFYETNEVRYESSGAFLIKATDAGAYSGTLELAGSTLRLSGAFPNGRAVTNVIARKNLSSITVTLGFDDCEPPQAIFGTVSDGSWTAPLMATPLHFHAKTNPAPTAGRYTMTIPGFGVLPGLPTGHGWGTVSITAAGKLKLAGVLADGTKLTDGSTLNEAGLWPFYMPYARNGGAVLGWITVTNGSGFGGALAWIRKTQPTTAKFYQAGFTNQTEAMGTLYTDPGRGTNVFTWTSGVALAGGGNLGGMLINQFNLGPANRVTWLGTNFTSLTFNPKDGRFEGKLGHNGTGKPATFNGVIHRGVAAGYGFFFGTNQSGAVVLVEP